MRRRIAVLGFAVTAVLAVAGVAGVAAQTGGSGSTNPADGYAERLAANLGIGEDELQAAIEKTRDEMIDDAVEQGRISPEFAEALKEGRFGDRILPFERFDFRFRPDEERSAVPPFSPEALTAPDGLISKALAPVAEAAGTDVTTLLDGLKSGKSPEQIAGEHGVTPEEFRQRLMEAFRSRFEAWSGHPLPFRFEFDPGVSPSSDGGSSHWTRT
ncbi:MAG: hypothetical protein AB7I38_10525 [Dehalococcoidia bacterium]